jgi:hypothetical protein
MPSEFRWNDWNRDHATRHGVPEHESEHVVRFAKRPYPRRQDAGKWLVVGRGTGDRFVEVVFTLDADGTACILHAMPLGGRRGRRRRRN